ASALLVRQVLHEEVELPLGEPAFGLRRRSRHGSGHSQNKRQKIQHLRSSFGVPVFDTPE
ncbi:MAG: hypothetical protein AAB733_00815, partial [Patescibacteria group bacterium]